MEDPRFVVPYSPAITIECFWDEIRVDVIQSNGQFRVHDETCVYRLEWNPSSFIYSSRSWNNGL